MIRAFWNNWKSIEEKQAQRGSNPFIHSGHFYSVPSSPLLLRGALDYSTNTVSKFHAEAHRQLQVKDLPKVPTWRLERTSLRLKGSTTIRLRTFRLRHFVYRHFVYYCIPACRTVTNPTSVSANHYFHQFKLLLALGFLFINPASTDTMIIQHIQLASIASWQSSLLFQLKTLIFINSTSS